MDVRAIVYTLQYIPEIIAWIIGIILAVLMLRRGGSLAEKLFFAGCCLMLAASIASPLLTEIVINFVFTESMSHIEKARMMSFAGMPVTAFQIAGLGCLVFAFWLKFRVKKQITAS